MDELFTTMSQEKSKYYLTFFGCKGLYIRHSFSQ
jgi:hypothetical protein